MLAAGRGAIIVTGNTSAQRGKAQFAGFAPTKAAQRILAEAIAREVGPGGIHVAYVMIDAVIDLAWTRERFAGQQAEQPDAQLMAPISPSPALLIDRSLERAGVLDRSIARSVAHK